MTYHINPAIGLPMSGNDYPSADVGGHSYGTRVDSRQPGERPPPGIEAIRLHGGYMNRRSEQGVTQKFT